MIIERFYRDTNAQITLNFKPLYEVIFLGKGIYLVASLLTLITLTKTKMGLSLTLKAARKKNVEF